MSVSPGMDDDGYEILLERLRYQTVALEQGKSLATARQRENCGCACDRSESEQEGSVAPRPAIHYRPDCAHRMVTTRGVKAVASIVKSRTPVASTSASDVQTASASRRASIW